MRRATIVFMFALACAGACGGGAIGDECDEEGAEGECDDGAVCGKPGDDDAVLECLKVCEEQADCPADQECNGVEGSSVKGCRTKDDATGSSGSGGTGGKK